MSMYENNEATIRYEHAAQEDRCAPRVKLSIPAKLRPSGDKAASVEVTDLSLAGFACDALTSMPAGTRCWVTLPGLGSLQAEIAWNNGQAIGCAFTNLLNPAVLDSIISRHAVPLPVN